MSKPVDQEHKAEKKTTPQATTGTETQNKRGDFRTDLPADWGVKHPSLNTPLEQTRLQLLVVLLRRLKLLLGV